MASHEAIDDEVMGRVALDEEGLEWRFTLHIPGRPPAKGIVVPSDHRLPLHVQGLNEIRERIRWVRDNDVMLRQRIADAMYQLMLDWQDDAYCAPLSKHEFQEKIALDGITILEDGLPYLTFDDAGLFAGHAIVADLNAVGQFKREPYLWG